MIEIEIYKNLSVSGVALFILAITIIAGRKKIDIIETTAGIIAVLSAFVAGFCSFKVLLYNSLLPDFIVYSVSVIMGCICVLVSIQALKLLMAKNEAV